MTYTAKGPNVLRSEKGSLLEKMYRENYAIQAEVSDVTQLAGTHRVTLTAFTGTNTVAATTGIDLASGADISVWGFVTPCACTLGHMFDYLTEAYTKDGATDAKIEVWTDEAQPVKLFTRTLTAAGENAKAYHDTAPTVTTQIGQGIALYLKAVNTGAGGTGHAIVTVEFIEAP